MTEVCDTVRDGFRRIRTRSFCNRTVGQSVTPVLLVFVFWPMTYGSTERPEQHRLAHLLSQYGIGIAYLLAVALLWTIGSFITQDLYSGGYNKPFLQVPYL